MREPPRGAELRERYDELVNSVVNTSNRAGEKIVVPRKGLEPPLLFGKRILSHSEVHSPSDNVRLVNSFISDRNLRGLSPNTIKFYKGYLTRFVNTISTPLLEQGKQGIIDFITSRTCNPEVSMLTSGF